VGGACKRSLRGPNFPGALKANWKRVPGVNMHQRNFRGVVACVTAPLSF